MSAMSAQGAAARTTESEKKSAQAEHRADAGEPAMRGPDEIRRPVSLPSCAR